MTSFNYKDHRLSNASKEIRLLKFEEKTSKWTLVSPVRLRFKDEETEKKEEEKGKRKKEEKGNKEDNDKKKTPFFVDDNKQSLEFTAVSYEWGDPMKNEKFRIDEEFLQIRRNLWDFFQAVSNHAKSKDLLFGEPLPQYFWIDAICIDQGNTPEKSAQIGILDKIYRSATCVVSWLGKVPRCTIMNHLLKEKSTKLIDGERKELLELLNVSYWTRVWMVQEIVLAKKWCIMCNDRIVDGDDLYGFVEEQFENECKRSRAGKHFQERRDFRARDTSPLLLLVCRFGYLDSTVAIDKIRGLLALCSQETGNLHDKLYELGNSEHLNDTLPYKNKVEKICVEMVRLAKESWPEFGENEKEIYCKLVRTVLGVQLQRLAEKLETTVSRPPSKSQKKRRVKSTPKSSNSRKKSSTFSTDKNGDGRRAKSTRKPGS